MVRIPLLPSGRSLVSHEVAVQKPMLVRVNRAKALGKVMALKSRCRTSYQFLAYMNLPMKTIVPLALVNEVCAHIQHLSACAVFNCQTHIPFHGGVITVRVESLRLVELQDSLFRDEWILRLALLHDDIKYYKPTKAIHRTPTAAWEYWLVERMVDACPIIKSMNRNKFSGKVQQAIEYEESFFQMRRKMKKPHRASLVEKWIPLNNIPFPQLNNTKEQAKPCS